MEGLQNLTFTLLRLLTSLCLFNLLNLIHFEINKAKKRILFFKESVIKLVERPS